MRRRLALLTIGLLPLALLAGTAVASAGEKPAATKPALAGPSASALLDKIRSCNQISKGKYKSDDETARNIAVCGATGAVFWKADMDIDCDGVRTSKCNEDTDPWFQPDTFLHTSKGRPFNAETMPYTVIPSPSGTFDYRKHNIKPGAVVAIIYNNQVLYTVFADTGPTGIIGEASYASASRLGINPDPENGGTDSGVAYIVFQGSKINPVESHSAATSLGERLANEFVENN